MERKFKVFFDLAETNIRAAANCLGWQNPNEGTFEDQAGRVLRALGSRLGVRPLPVMLYCRDVEVGEWLELARKKIVKTPHHCR
jgi:hypothetical protein